MIPDDWFYNFRDLWSIGTGYQDNIIAGWTTTQLLRDSV